MAGQRSSGPKDAYYETNLAVFKVVVGRIGGQSWIFKGFADGEMVEALIVIVAKTHDFMNGIIKKTANARASDPAGFSFQIQQLPENSGYPEQISIAIRCGGDNVFKFCDHSQREGAGSGNILMTADHHGLLPEIAF